MVHTISNTDDMIDSRDVIKRIAELEDERDSWPVAAPEGAPDDWEPTDEQRAAAWLADCGDDAAELAALLKLADEAEGCADWTYGETLIRDGYFERYAMELAEDIGAINPDATWPNDCIDWKRAARQLQYDYTSVDFDGETYWIRS